jgi:hypothetical protein
VVSDQDSRSPSAASVLRVLARTRPLTSRPSPIDGPPTSSQARANDQEADHDKHGDGSCRACVAGMGDQAQPHDELDREGGDEPDQEPVVAQVATLDPAYAQQ